MFDLQFAVAPCKSSDFFSEDCLMVQFDVVGMLRLTRKRIKCNI